VRRASCWLRGLNPSVSRSAHRTLPSADLPLGEHRGENRVDGHVALMLGLRGLLDFRLPVVAGVDCQLPTNPERLLDSILIADASQQFRTR